MRKSNVYQRVGRGLQRVMQSDASYALLPNGTWSAGGCWTLAAAFKDWAGNRGKLVAVASPRNNTEHVVVKIDDFYYDADGAQSYEDLLRKMERVERVPAPRITAFRRTNAGDITCSRTAVVKLRRLLGENLGPSPFKKR